MTQLSSARITRSVCAALFAAALAALPAQAQVNTNSIGPVFDVIGYLKAITGKNTVTGMHNGSPTTGNFALNAGHAEIKSITTYYPGLWGADFGWDWTANINRQKIVDKARSEWGYGNLVTVMWHQVKPLGGQGAYDGTNGTPKGTVGSWEQVHTGRNASNQSGSLTDTEWNELLTNDTPRNKQWKADMGYVADYLKQLQSSNVPVLWRPYHEMNGDWFWWGGKPSQFKRLWIQTFNFMKARGVNNLIWVWSPNAPKYWNTGSYADYYPGNAYVDVLACDLYNDGSGSDFNISYYNGLLSLAGSKPIALSEVGDMPTTSVLTNQPKWAYFMQWDGGWLRRENSDSLIQSTFNSSRTIKSGHYRKAP